MNEGGGGWNKQKQVGKRKTRNSYNNSGNDDDGDDDDGDENDLSTPLFQ